MPYRVIGSHAVAGVAPGGVVDDDIAGALNVDALIAAGHLAAVTTRNKPTPTEPVDNEED